jgi:hypothetical protein
MKNRSFGVVARIAALFVLFSFSAPALIIGQRRAKPVLYGRHWMAVRGKPIAVTGRRPHFYVGADQRHLL